MSFRTILFSLDQGVATLTFNRPEKLNAVNQEMAQEIGQAVAEVAGDPAIRVLLLTGAGRAFMAGADIRIFLEMDPLAGKRFAEGAQNLLFQLESLEVPVLACVNGLALGGGLEIAMACDLIYASEEARFGLPEVSLGIIPCLGGTQRLARLVGKGLAKELCLTGRTVDAAEARMMGLAAQVFPAAAFPEECLKVAQSLAQRSRAALAATKRVIDRGFDLDLRSALALEADAFALCLAGPDPREGAAAFLEKRPPRFA